MIYACFKLNAEMFTFLWNTITFFYPGNIKHVRNDAPKMVEGWNYLFAAVLIGVVMDIFAETDIFLFLYSIEIPHLIMNV